MKLDGVQFPAATTMQFSIGVDTIDTLGRDGIGLGTESAWRLQPLRTFDEWQSNAADLESASRRCEGKGMASGMAPRFLEDRVSLLRDLWLDLFNSPGSALTGRSTRTPSGVPRLRRFTLRRSPVNSKVGRHSCWHGGRHERHLPRQIRKHAEDGTCAGRGARSRGRRQGDRKAAHRSQRRAGGAFL